MSIPIRNLYYLLVYAWDALEEGELVDVSSQPAVEILDMLGGVLNNGVHHVLRRGLDRAYIQHKELIPGIRGKIDISATVKVNSFGHPRTVCEFDELSHDIVQNQLIRATLQRLLAVDKLDSDLRDALAGTNRRLHEIGKINVTNRTFQTVQIHRNNRFYRFLIQVCRLIHENLQVDSTTDEVRFRDFLRDERRMRKLFERFVYNFYSREQTKYRVGRDRIQWSARGTPGGLKLLPEMRTDVSLTSAAIGRKIVIDTKYYREALQRNFEKQTIRSSHLYQMFAYLKNLAARGGINEVAEGILLYPTVGQAFDHSYVILGHSIRVCTIDLNKAWQDIRRDLFALLDI